MNEFPQPVYDLNGLIEDAFKRLRESELPPVVAHTTNPWPDRRKVGRPVHAAPARSPLQSVEPSHGSDSWHTRGSGRGIGSPRKTAVVDRGDRPYRIVRALSGLFSIAVFSGWFVAAHLL